MIKIEIKHILFTLVLLFFLFFIYLVFFATTTFKIMFFTWFFPALLLLILILILVKIKPFRQVKEYERLVIFRFGKVNRVVGPGWIFFIPWIENYKAVDTRVQVLDVPPQNVITKDAIPLTIDAVIYMRVNPTKEDVLKSVINVKDYKEAARLYIISAIRDVVGSLTMEEVISSIESINKRLKEHLEKVSNDWGIKVESVTIKTVTLPNEVLEAMNKQKAAERQKLAMIERAQGVKAEIEAIKEATKDLSNAAIMYYYLKSLEKLSEGAATKIIFPLELSNLANMLSGRISKGKDLTKEEFEELLEKYTPLIEEYLSKIKKAKEENQK